MQKSIVEAYTILFLLILLIKLTKLLQIDNVIISIEPRIIKLSYQIKDFMRIDYDFISLISSAIIEFISYIIAYYYRLVEIITRVERAIVTSILRLRLSLLESTSIYSINWPINKLVFKKTLIIFIKDIR